MNMTRNFFAALSVLVVLALAGCSSGAPSSSDVEQALKSGMAKAMSQASSVEGGQAVSAMMAKVEIKSVKVLECNKDASGTGFDCKVETEVSTPFAGDQKNTRMLHLVKGSDGWVIAR
ncbi:hypothetical protein [Halothiobacillus neapolitanus]|jgi:hypothetical protein|uniref:Lipoprotein n=1 Tax=Halothiobacillus neapolitanus (strain ATCC 23641 / DSM 15147 / CIP 104769 / NCIMB 8539 / c2) TaxID=555778 RepID=D0KXV1_HALNC|nr:hypothetical protein [Halothiobacillus neapolitanus]ACX95274.1 conserved hypothetical protein [Halothiobacillus neapolitanus c2]OZB75607.1 MAG: hypothetical protein B7X37_01900 [Halothiobacillus sp. 14-55-98]TDN59379.1 hypothetical protein C8D83_10645 [Halothiobacillus neapolitanus]